MSFAFGLAIDTPRERYWGARAIYKNGTIDLLSDRQSFDSSSAGPETDAFVLWLNVYALPWLRAEVKRLDLATNDPQMIVLSQFKYELRASTNASYGYLYIGAVEHKLVEGEPRINTATNEPERVVVIRDEKIVVDKGIVPVGTEGVVKVNGIGPAIVVGYFNEKYDGDHKLACLMVEVSAPPKWWIDQTIERELVEAVKSGVVARKRGAVGNVPSPAAEKEFRKNWKPKPFPLWPNDFVPNQEAKAA
jgi:hypothetical protein